MFSSQSVRVNYEPERTLAFGAIGAVFTALGAPLAFPCIQFVMDNQTDQTIQFSIDGINPMRSPASGASFCSDLSANKGLGGDCLLPAGTQIYVQYVVAPAAGAVYFTSAYRDNNNNK